MKQILVLAIDDEAPIRQWMQYCISQMDGFECITAASGNEGIRLWQAKKPDIIVTDIEMPGMDGLQMLELIMKKEPDIYSIVLTSHEDFGYARTALHLGTTEYILKTEMTEESLTEVLGNARKVLAKKSGNQVHDLKSRNHYLQMIAFHNPPIRLDMEELRSQGIDLEEESILALDLWGADKSVWELPVVVAWGRKTVTFSIGNDHEIVVLNTSKTEKEIKVLVEDYLKERGIVEGVSCGISRRYASPIELGIAMDEARYRCSLRFYEPGKLIFYKEKPCDITKEEEELHLEFMQLLLKQDFVKAYRCLHSYMELYRERQPQHIEQMIRTISTNLISYMHFATDPSEDMEEQDSSIKDRILNARNLDDMEQAVTEIIDPVVHFANETSVFSAPIIKAIEYMEKHYNEKFTLTDMAEQVAFSPEYFSRLFSKETGVNYITYLNNIRMKNAISLLETTELKVYEIAEQVGFASLSYFSTAFKKKFGKNPYEYQVSYKRGKR